MDRSSRGASGGASASKSRTAFVTFRVKCETIQHGESVYLVPEDNISTHSTGARGLPMLTNTKKFPWFFLAKPLPLSLPSRSATALTTSGEKEEAYRYRFVVYRAGKFHRTEAASDVSSADAAAAMVVNDDSVGKDSNGVFGFHRLFYQRLHPGQSYVVSDILGSVAALPSVETVRIERNDETSSIDLGSLHNSSRGSLKSGPGHASSGKLNRTKSGTGKGSSSNIRLGTDNVRKLAGSANVSGGPVTLDSTDGVVVASAFLPVHVRRSDDGEWSADWDHEALLSMQTHLRVTRVGIVKWRGWHGNVGADGSPECGVPLDERHKVEKCLRPFNCVPVWCEPSLFGEMYNGFCKGVLWPILHNVSTVYSSVPEGRGSDGGGPLDQSVHPAEAAEEAMFSDMTTDDVAFPIHGDGGREAELWSAYTAVNRQFAEVVVECFHEGDLVWINGFHLLLLPSFLTRKIPMAKTGIFLHTPFPSSEIFRTLWCKDDLLRGMLNADQVGFHLYEYARHFLTACRRQLGFNYGMISDGHGGHGLAIECNGRHVTVTSIHAGIAPPVLDHVLSLRSTFDQVMNIQKEFSDRVIFCGIDRLESLKGIPLKLLGLERFLERCPDFVGKVVLVQVGISAFERGDDYARTKREISNVVDKINRRWPGTVHFRECPESEMRLHQRMAVLRAADVFIVTSVRDGLNLMPLEFVHAHKDTLTDQGRRDGRKRGLVILSEFSSGTRVMRGALHVNPWKVSEIANAIYQSLNMSQDERLRRVETAADFIGRVTTQRWALAVMLDLKGVQKNEDVARYAGAGLGLGYRLLRMDAGFDALDTTVVAKAYRTSRSRLILLDYGGTILTDDNLDRFSRYALVKQKREYTSPTARLISLLTDLCSDPKNTVFVVSGKERRALMKTLHGIPNLGLGAEHGMFVSWPTNNTNGDEQERKWETTVPVPDDDWRTIAVNIMEVYTSRTQGSYIEETEMKVLWQYRDADPEFGDQQSRELEDHLSNVLRSHRVDVLHGGRGLSEGGFAGYVEVRPKGVNKGVLSTLIIQKLTTMGKGAGGTSPTLKPKKVDFCLAIGDDHCDEPMLSVIRQIGRRVRGARLASRGEPPLPPAPPTVRVVDVSMVDHHVSKDLQCFTCTVGKKPTAAANYLNDVEEVHELLEALNKIGTRENRGYYSSVNLRKGLLEESLGTVKESVTTTTEGQSADVKSPPLAFLNSSYNETISAGITRSKSLNMFGSFYSRKGADNQRDTNAIPSKESATPSTVSASLGKYLNEIQDDEEDPFYF